MGKIFNALEKSEKESGRPVSLKPDPLNVTEEWDLISVQKPHSVEAEHFRALKNSILFPESGNPPRTIMVTSTSHGEGKSFVASNLAVAIASSIDEHVLLVDCDLHKPTVHSMFGLENNKGLSTYLTQNGKLSSFMVKTFLDKLTVLPGGPPPINPSELISSEQMRQLITEVEARYDDRYILLDAPPPLITSETNALAKHVEGILLVVKHGYTQKDRIQDVIDIYGREKILGVVYNFARGKFGLDYDYKYRYGYENKKG
ncbi:MAG: CpsD/CapB family tyrosine-protein kinase [Desulfobacterales bacterium]|nr:CpsD/CapB family tyrosine-protein kinase [Desulfobacterales bacterium]